MLQPVFLSLLLNLQCITRNYLVSTVWKLLIFSMQLNILHLKCVTHLISGWNFSV